MNRITKGIYNLFAAYIMRTLQPLRNNPYCSIISKTYTDENNSYQRKPGEWKRNPQHLRSWRMDRPDKNRNQRGTRHKIALYAPLYESWQRRILRTHWQVAAHLSLRGIRKKQKQRAKTETLQRHSDVGGKPSGRIVRSGAGETAGGFVTTNLGSFCRK